MLADSDNGAASDFSYHPRTRVRAFSLRRCGEATRLLVSEAVRSDFEAREAGSGGLLVLFEIDFPSAMPAPSGAKLLLAAFGLARIQHLAAPNNRQISENRSRSAPERPSAVR